MTPRQKAITVIRILRKGSGSTMLGRISEDPFQVLIATVLSARVRDETTEVVAKALFKRWPDAHSLSKGKLKDVEKAIHSCGFYHEKARRIIGISKEIVRLGSVPETMEGLLALHGVGRKTAGCVLVYAYGKPAIPVDTHVHRISNRLGLVKTKQPEKTEQALMNIVPKRQWVVVNDLFVGHGKTICRPVGPKCGVCPVKHYCNYRRALLPMKTE
ncbi:MAG: endonuclease III [Nanoarchaeota archaeon]